MKTRMTGSSGRGKGAKRRRRKSLSGAPDPSSSNPRSSFVAAPAANRRGSRIIGALLLGLASLFFAASTWLFLLFPTERGPGDGRSVELIVSRDSSSQDLAALLSDAGLVSSPRLFAVWVTATGGSHAVRAGKHLLTDDASPRELMARLERRSGGGTVRVTFPEGWTRFDVARRLEERHVVALRAFLDATTDPDLLQELDIGGDSAEGFLFPATYDLGLDGDPVEIVRRMKREFDRRWDMASQAHSATLNDVMTSAQMSVRDVVILASMIEKEAAVDEERPMVASVFLNRLRDPAFRPRRLECDPTASYGCIVAPERAASCADFTGKATPAIEHDPDNPYSTYTHEGLPPGPIANPGVKSLEAAMAPATTHYFFFVARGGGRHTFSETYESHAAAVRGGAARR